MRLLGPLTLLPGLLAFSSAQDAPAPGFTLAPAAHPPTSPLAVSATLASGAFVVFDGLVIELRASDGALVRSLGALPGPVFPSFLRSNAGEQFVCFGESSNGSIYRLALDSGGSPEFLANLPFNYDGALFGDHLYVSAATCGFSCDNEIWRVDLDPPHLEARGVMPARASLIARVPGASGPLVTGPGGELYYASVSGSFPPPAGHASVWKWMHAEVEGERLLGLTDADPVGSGFEGAARLAIDPRDSSLFLAETNFATGHNRVLQVLGNASQSPVLVEGRTFFATGNLDFHAGTGAARFLAHQPASGGTLTYTTSDFFASPERLQVRPLRPQAALSVPAPGVVRLVLENGPPLGFARVLVGPRDQVLPEELPFLIAGIPLFFGLEQASAVFLPGLLPLNSSGGLRQLSPDPGGTAATLAIQLLLYDSQLRRVATSTVATL